MILMKIAASWIRKEETRQTKQQTKHQTVVRNADLGRRRCASVVRSPANRINGTLMGKSDSCQMPFSRKRGIISEKCFFVYTNIRYKMLLGRPRHCPRGVFQATNVLERCSRTIQFCFH